MSKHSAINRFGRSSNPAFSRNFNQGGFRTQSSSEMNVGSGFRTTSSVAESASCSEHEGDECGFYSSSPAPVMCADFPSSNTPPGTIDL